LLLQSVPEHLQTIVETKNAVWLRRFLIIPLLLYPVSNLLYRGEGYNIYRIICQLKTKKSSYMNIYKWNCTPSHLIYFIAYSLLSKSILELREDYEAKHQLLWTMHSRVPQAFPLNLVLLFHELSMVHQSVDFQQNQPSN
jgi:hypothetical protein